MPVEPDISIAARAGLVVPRASSKFVQPAFVFSVAPRTQDSKPN